MRRTMMLTKYLHMLFSVHASVYVVMIHIRKDDRLVVFVFFFFQAEDGIRDLTVTGVQTCALPIWGWLCRIRGGRMGRRQGGAKVNTKLRSGVRRFYSFAKFTISLSSRICALRNRDRKSTRLNSSHSQISYAVFCLKKKKQPSQSFI